LKLIGAGLAVFGLMIGVFALPDRYGLSNDSLRGLVWAILTCAGVAYLLVCAILGRERVEELVRRVFKRLG